MSLLDTATDTILRDLRDGVTVLVDSTLGLKTTDDLEPRHLDAFHWLYHGEMPPPCDRRSVLDRLSQVEAN